MSDPERIESLQAQNAALREKLEVLNTTRNKDRGTQIRLLFESTPCFRWQRREFMVKVERHLNEASINDPNDFGRFMESLIEERFEYRRKYNTMVTKYECVVEDKARLLEKLEKLRGQGQ